MLIRNGKIYTMSDKGIIDGGDIRVEIDDNGEGSMTGKVSKVYDGILRMDL